MKIEHFYLYRPAFPTEKFGGDRRECFDPNTLNNIGRTRTDVAVVTTENCGGIFPGRHVDVWEAVGRAENEQSVITRLVVQLQPSQYRLLMATSPSNCL